MKKLISELRASFKPYEQYWLLWAERNKNTLSEDELLIINSYIFCEFQYPLLENTEKMEQIINKLNYSYRYYQQHLINMFRDLLAAYCIENDQLETYFLEVSELDVSDAFKEILLKFKARYLLQLLLPDPHLDLKQPENFKIVCRALKCLWSHYYLNKKQTT